MANGSLNKSEESALNVGQIQSEKIAFEPEEMLACARCARMNPPNRLKCFYCANELEVKGENVARIKPILRKLESWEKGFNLIYLADQCPNETEVAKIANLLSRDAADLKTIFDAGVPLPLALVESEREAARIAEGLKQLGVKCSIVSDEQLQPERLPTRLRALQFEIDRIVAVDFNTAKAIEIARDDLALIVKGTIFQSKTESIKKLKRGGKGEILDETPTASDEILIDIYRRDDPLGFRILPHGFDFSCLGVAKGILAVENVRSLIVALKDFAPEARLVTDFTALKNVLGQVWEIEERKDPLGLRRSGFGKREMGHVASSNNLNQCTRYSRLQWHLL